MKVIAVEPYPVDRYLFVKVHTDEGITGFGESGAWGHLEASRAAIEKFGRYLVGKDPLRIEHHWQSMYRSSHFRGAAIMGGISAIDIALWDIAGKHFGVPVYQLVGGMVRDKARVYYHVFWTRTGRFPISRPTWTRCATQSRPSSYTARPLAKRWTCASRYTAASLLPRP
jgi:galactonate dehydratase